MTNLTPAETQLLRHLVRLSGRSPIGYAASVLPSSSIRVLGPRGAVVYPIEGWVSKFLRHLHQGYFDGVPSGLAAQQAGQQRHEADEVPQGEHERQPAEVLADERQHGGSQRREQDR